MRALRIVARDALRPPVGSSVDVLVTFESSDAAGGGAPTVVAARGVLVLGTDETPAAVETGAADRGAGGQGGGALTALGVTLLVTEEDAPRLAFAAAAGVVTLALVPPEDAAR
jgi:Flp pilus assembly protein CpaB